MKKSDLRTGMLVLVKDKFHSDCGYKDGKWYIVINDKMYNTTKEEYGFCFLDLNCYNDNLEYDSDKGSWVIYKIANIECHALTFLLRDAVAGNDITKTTGFKVIWERKESVDIKIDLTINTDKSIDNLNKFIEELKGKYNIIKYSSSFVTKL